MRKPILLLLSLILLATGAVLGITSQNRGLADVSLPPAVAPRLWPGLGVTVALEQDEPAARAAVLDAVAAAGFTWVRQRFPWDQIEPARGQFDWATWDGIIADVTQRNLGLVAVLDGAPTWARAPEDAANPLAPPTDHAAFGRFARAFAERYGQQARFYQIWDEPNIAPHWGTRLVDAMAYTGLLREAAIQIRSADSDAVILLAALAPNVEPGGVNQSDLSYLDALYRTQAASWFDVVTGQPYGFAQAPQADPAPDTLNFRRAELLRQIMEAHDDGETPLWVTAYGWHAPLPEQVGKSSWDEVDEATQARWAVEAADWALSHWPWLGGLAWAIWQPSQPSTDPRWGFALVDPAGAARPVLNQLQAWTAAPHALGPGEWTPAEPALTYEGGWRSTALAADPPPSAQAGNNRLLIPFNGTGLALHVQRGPYWAYFDVIVDGQPANALPQDPSGRANLVLYDPLAAEATVTVAEGLPAGEHLAEIVATGGWSQWPLRGILVLGAPDATPSWAWLSWILALAGLIALALVNDRVFGAAQRLVAAVVAPLARGIARLQAAPVALQYGVLVVLAASTALLPVPWQLAALAALFAWLAALPQLALPLLGTVTPLFLVTVPILGRPLFPTEIVVWLAVAALTTRWLLGRLAADDAFVLRPAPFSALDGAVVALLVLAGLATISASNLGVALREFRVVLLEGALAYALVRVMPADRAVNRFDPWPLAWGIGAGALVVALWGIYQATAGAGLITAEGVWRVRGPFGSPNNLALYLGHTLPIFLAVAALGVDRRKRLVAALLALPLLLGLALTFSKGALLLGLPAAVLFIGLAGGGRWRWIALAALALGALALLPLFRTERFAGLFDLESGTSFFRLQLWRGAWNMALDHPWLGVGPDNFLYAYRTTYVLPAAWQELNLSHPHNILLDFWTRLGLPSVLVGVWLFMAAFGRGWRAFRGNAGDARALALGLLASLAATLAHGLIDNSLFLVDLMFLFMLSIGLIARLSEDG